MSNLITRQTCATGKSMLGRLAKQETVAGTPAVAAIEHYRETFARWTAIFDDVDNAEFDASKKHGGRPFALIAWRRYSAIGGVEIDNAREEFLSKGLPSDEIEREYRDAKKRYQAAVESGRKWDRKAGLTKLRKASEQTTADLRKAQDAVGAAPILNLGDASAMASLLDDNMAQFDDFSKWEKAALQNLARFLKRATKVGETK